jgi:hypothetical protein
VYNVRCIHISNRPGLKRLRMKTDLVLSFTRMADFLESNIRRQERLVEWFPHTPTAFWSKTCIQHNGFFGSQTSSENAISSPKYSPASSSTTQTDTSSPSRSAADRQETVSTYFRLIIKTLESSDSQEQVPVSGAPSEKDYKWYEMGFISFCSNTRSTVLCFDVSEVVIKGLTDTFSASAEQYGGPFGLHIPLLEELLKLYDRSVWAMAKKVREIEKVCRDEYLETSSPMMGLRSSCRD